jgi:predicted membrane protein
MRQVACNAWLGMIITMKLPLLFFALGFLLFGLLYYFFDHGGYSSLTVRAASSLYFGFVGAMFFDYLPKPRGKKVGGN